MVLGMNTGRSGDNRRGNAQGRKDNESTKQDPTPQITSIQQHKHKPSAEQVHIARLLTDDRTPSDIQERVFQVQTVVDCPEENIIIALHDNEFDVEKACEALLDSNGSSKEEWTTMATSKKSKKKVESTTSSKKGVSTKGTSKAAAQHTRQAFGGNVTVTTASSSGEDTERERRGRGRSHQPGSKGRPGRRGERNMGPRKRNDRDALRGREGRAPQKPQQPAEEPWDKETGEEQPTVTMATTLEITEDPWDVDGTVQPKPSSLPRDDWVMVNVPGPYSDLGGVNLQQQQQPPVVDMMISSPVDDKSRTKLHHRRFKASEIPLQPVEMPSGIDALTLDMSTLGIDFGFESAPFSPPISDPLVPTSIQTPVSPSTVIIPTSPHTSNPSFEQQSSRNQSANPPLMPGSPYPDIADDPVIVSSYTEKPPDNLEPPPGLIHPSQQQQQQQPADKPPQATPSLLPPPPEPISLPPLTAPPSSSTSQSPGGGGGGNLGLLSTNMTSGGLTNPTEATASSTSYPIGGMGLHTTGNSSYSVSSSVTTPTSAQQLFSAHSVSAASPVVPMTTVPPVPLSSSLSSASGVSSSSSRAPNTSHPTPLVASGPQGKVHSAGTGGNVHPMAAAGMVYPPFLHQLAGPYGTTPVMMPPYTYDVDQMSRYQQGFYGQHPTSQDQGGGASLVSGLGRDPQTGGGGGTSSFGTDNKYDSSSNNPIQQQQQGALQQPHNQMNAFYSHYPNMLYTMYPHMGMAAAAATPYSTQPMAHKPGAATTYPGGTSYQPNPQFPHYEEADYTKLYASLGKTSQVPSTSSADYNAYSKHQFDTKGAAGYSNYPHALGGPMGGYVLGHHIPPMGGTPIMTHDTSSRSKPHKYNQAGWPGASSHT